MVLQSTKVNNNIARDIIIQRIRPFCLSLYIPMVYIVVNTHSNSSVWRHPSDSYQFSGQLWQTDPEKRYDLVSNYAISPKEYSVVYNSESGSAWKAPLVLLRHRARFPSPSVPLYTGNSKQWLINLHHWIHLNLQLEWWSPNRWSEIHSENSAWHCHSHSLRTTGRR